MSLFINYDKSLNNNEVDEKLMNYILSSKLHTEIHQISKSISKIEKIKNNNKNKSKQLQSSNPLDR